MTTATKERAAKRTAVETTTMGQAIIASLSEAIAFKRGAKNGTKVKTVTARTATAVPAPRYRGKDIAKLRKQMHLSQPLFADVLNVSAACVKAWEQGQNEPNGSALRLLQIAETHPEVLLEQVTTVGA